MGKSNRIRANRAATGSVMSLNTKPQKKEMPSWLMTVIAIVVAAAILLSVVGLLLSANGVFGRWATALSTKHFKVNANMLSYYYFTQYQNFLEENESYLSYYSLDTSKSHKEQRFGGPENAEDGAFYYDVLLGEFEGTWFDYFMDQTVTSVSSLLVYCEGAYEMGLELDDADHEQIDANVAALEANAAQYAQYYANVDSYISDLYGDGVKIKDIRTAMEYSALATKYMTTLSNQISEEITKEDVDATYAADTLKFDVIDYSYYSFETSYTEAKKEAGFSDIADSALSDEQKAKIAEKYVELVAEVQSYAAKLLEKKTAEEVNTLIYQYVAAKQVKAAWAQQTIKVEDPTTIKAVITGEIVQELLLGNTESTAPSAETNIGYKGLSEEVMGQLVTVKNTAFSEALAEKELSVLEKVNYVGENDEFSVWAFKAERVAGDTYEIDGENNKLAAEVGGTYTEASYFLTQARYKDPDKTKNVAYMLFTDEKAAQAAVALMMERGVTTLDAFEALADEVAADANTHLEDYVKGGLQSDIFDTWLYAAETKVGSYTGAPLKLEDGATYCVALYYAEGNEGWYVTVKNAILTERFDAKVAELEATFEVTVKEKALDRVDA